MIRDHVKVGLVTQLNANPANADGSLSHAPIP